MPNLGASFRVALCGIPALLAADLVLAQEALEEIVVTALKRAESLQDTPATVTAFDASTIEEARIQSMRDYVNLTSNMTLMETQNNAFAFVNIRGLAQIRNVEPTVAVVVDGVLQTTSLAFSQDLYDIQQIEVLKGPQGALYGRNASGGAINITTKQPTSEPEFYVRGGYGNGDNVSLSGVASGPLNDDDTLLGRFVVGYRDADGWRDNVATKVKADPYENLTVAGKLLWDISNDVTLDLRLAYSDTESTGSQFVSNAPNFVTGFPGNAQYPGNGSAPPVPGLPASITALIGDPNNTSIKHQGNEPGMDDRETVSLSAKVDWEIGAGTLTSITSIDTLDHVTAAEQFAYYPFVEVAGTPGAGSHPAGVVVPPAAAGLAAFGTGQNLTFGQNRFHDSFSQEVRFTSPDDRRLRWIAGGYYAQTDLDVMISINNDFGVGFQEQHTDPNVGGINPTVTWTQRFLAPLLPILGGGAAALNQNTNPSALAYNFDSNHNVAYALFGQINYDLTDDLELSAALRYDRDDRELTIMALDQYLPVFAFPSGRQGDIRQADFDSVQPKVTLSWRPNDNWTVYGTYAEGFRSGGFNLSGVATGVATLIAAGVPGLPLGVRDSYDQEDTSGVEFGFKSTLLDGQLRFDSALFYTEVDNGFTFVFVAPFTAQTTRNIKSADVRGAEASVSWLATQHLEVDVGLGVLDSEITESDWVGAGGISIIGKKMPQNPESTANVGLSYHGELGANREWYARLDYRRLGEVFWEPENFVARDPLDLVDFRIGITSSRGWEVVGWIDNATDEDWISEESNPNGIVYYGKPRQYGVEMTYRF
jgi:iron complex outermembrane receptor protein